MLAPIGSGELTDWRPPHRAAKRLSNRNRWPGGREGEGVAPLREDALRIGTMSSGGFRTASGHDRAHLSGGPVAAYLCAQRRRIDPMLECQLFDVPRARGCCPTASASARRCSGW